MDRLHCPSEIPGHAASERVPCPGWIVNVFERIRATTEELIAFTEEQCTVLAFFYRHVLRPHLADAPAGLDEASLLCYFTRFAVVEDEQINALKQRVEISSRRLDPEIHCVRDNEARPFHLVEHMRLQRGCDVGQQNELGFTICFREYRLEIFEDVERDRACLTRVQVP